MNANLNTIRDVLAIPKQGRIAELVPYAVPRIHGRSA